MVEQSDWAILAIVVAGVMIIIATSPNIEKVDVSGQKFNVTVENRNQTALENFTAVIPSVQPSMTSEDFVDNILALPDKIPFINKFDRRIGWVIIVLIFYLFLLPLLSSMSLAMESKISRLYGKR